MMFWMILIVVALILMVFLESLLGKFVAALAVLAMGFLIISWISDIALFVTLAKICTVIIVISVVGLIIAAIFG